MLCKNSETSAILSVSIDDPLPDPFSCGSTSLASSLFDTWETDEETAKPSIQPKVAIPAVLLDEHLAADVDVIPKDLKPVACKLKKKDRRTVNNHLGRLINHWSEKDKRDKKGLVSQICSRRRCKADIWTWNLVLPGSSVLLKAVASSNEKPVTVSVYS
jgi:hypothetical protein